MVLLIYLLNGLNLQVCITLNPINCLINLLRIVAVIGMRPICERGERECHVNILKSCVEMFIRRAWIFMTMLTMKS